MRDTIVWNTVGSPKYTYFLHYDPNGELESTPQGIAGGQTISLTFANAGPGGDVFKRHPYLTGFSAFEVDPADLSKIPEVREGADRRECARSKRQSRSMPAVCRRGACSMHVFFTDSPLGVTWVDGNPTLRVWAPTARSVQCCISTTIPLRRQIPCGP